MSIYSVPTQNTFSSVNLNNDSFSQGTVSSSGGTEIYYSKKDLIDSLLLSFSSLKLSNTMSTAVTSLCNHTEQKYLSEESTYLKDATYSLYKPTSISISHTATNGLDYNFTHDSYSSNQYFIVNSTGNTPTSFDVSFSFPKNTKSIKRNLLKKNLSPHIYPRANPIKNKAENERVAIESLREQITESEFRKYMKFGFVLVRGQNGKTYQIFRNKQHIKVWEKGKVIEEICVRIKNYKIPPTDKIIAFLNMIQIDEEEFRKTGNIYNMQKAA